MADLDLDQAIVALVNRDAVKVPPYPAVAFRIEAVLRTGDYGVDEIARLVSADQVLTADVIRCANSAAYSRGSGVAASVLQAVGRIGAKDVARLALASGLGAQAVGPGRLSSVRRRAWLEALASAGLCQALAPRRRIAPDVAFAAGLLHDFGRVVAIGCVEEIIEKSHPPGLETKEEEHWFELIEGYHVELGMVVAARWGLPQVLADVISLHHREASGAQDPALVRCVAASDEVVSLLGDRVALSREDSALAPLVSKDEQDAVLSALRALPGFIASFETSESFKTGGESLVEPGNPARLHVPRSPYEVTVTLGGRDQVFRLVGIDSTHLMLSGPGRVPENVLFQMKVKCDPPLEGFARAKVALSKGETVTLVAQPYALSAESILRFKALVAECGSEP